MQKKRTLLFDLDGTLTDPMIGITRSVQYALQHFGIKVQSLEELIPFIGPPLKQSFETFYGFSEEDAEKAVTVYREYFSVTGLFENKVYEGIPELLSTLKEDNKRLFVATSKPTVFARQILEHFGLSQYFEDICGSFLSGERVEKIDVIRHVLDEHKLSPEDTVMVGDRRFDVDSAKALGLSTLGVLYGYGNREEIEKAAPDKIANTVCDLSALLL